MLCCCVVAGVVVIVRVGGAVDFGQLCNGSCGACVVVGCVGIVSYFLCCDGWWAEQQLL